MMTYHNQDQFIPWMQGWFNTWKSMQFTLCDNKETKKSNDHLINREKALNEMIHSFIYFLNFQQARKKNSI